MMKGIFHNWIMKCLFCHFCRCFFLFFCFLSWICRVMVMSRVSSNCVVAIIIVHRPIVYIVVLFFRYDFVANGYLCGMWRIQYYSLPSFDFGFWLPVPLWPYSFFMTNFPHDKIKMVIARCQQNVLCLLTSNFPPFSFI